MCLPTIPLQLWCNQVLGVCEDSGHPGHGGLNALVKGNWTSTIFMMFQCRCAAADMSVRVADKR